MAKPLNLVHLANFNSTNIGNGALISGTEHLLASDLAAGIAWLREPWDDYTFGSRQFDRRFVEMVNGGDGLVVNGAVAIHGRDYLRETGMRFELPLDLIGEIRRPIVFYGISYRHFRGQPFHHQDVLRRTLAFLAGRPNVFLGVRNDGTKKWLRETLLAPPAVLENIHEVSDPGVFVQARKGDYPEIMPGRRVIVFAPNDEDAPFRYGDANAGHARETGYRLGEESVVAEPTAWQANRARLIAAVTDALSEVLQRSQAQLLLVPHYLDDLKFIAALTDSLPPAIVHQLTISTGLMRGPGTAFFYGRYLAADMAVSMRVHSLSPCIGLGVPTVPLITQPRLWDFLDRTGLADLGLDAFAEDLRSRLAQECLAVLNDPDGRRERFLRARMQMREDARAINSRLAALFEGKK